MSSGRRVGSFPTLKVRNTATPGSHEKLPFGVRLHNGHFVVEMRVRKGLKTWMRVESPELGAKYADRITHYRGKGVINNKDTASIGAAVLPEGGLASFPTKESFQKFISGQCSGQTPTTTLPTPITSGNTSTSTASCSANQYNASSSGSGTLGVSLNGSGCPETVIEFPLSRVLEIMDADEESSTVNTSNSGPAAEESPPAQPMVDAGRNLQAAPDEIARVQSTSFTADGFANALETTAVNDGAHIMTTPNNPSDWTILETADGPFLSTEAPHMFNLWRKEFETVQQQKRLIKHLEEELKHNQEINSQLLKENEGLQIEKSHLEDKIRANELQWNSVNLSWLPPANYNRDDLEDFLPSLENY